jgi:predicted acetylornithine/succinylornithine family transaminase
MKTATDVTTREQVMALESAHVLQVYRRSPVVFERGEGCVLFDAAGQSYLDFTSGVGVAALGHGNVKLAAALAAQAADLVHTSNLFFHPLQGQVAARLAALSGLPRAFFCNSGAEAVEACLKFARRFWHAQGTPRRGIVALERAFHGRTMGALSVTWDEHYRAPFAPLLADVTFVPADDPVALKHAVSTATAAVIVEPIQGEGGVRPLSPAMAEAIGAACHDTGALLIADEIQCGLGRTGMPFYSSALGLQPDLMSVGKSLGAGMPIGAALFSERVAATASFGDHGSTYGGNLLACRAALVFLEELQNGLLDQVRAIGAEIGEALDAIATRQPAVKNVRGAGVIWGIELDRPAAPVVEAALERGLLINRTADTVIRLLPPYIVTPADVARMAVVLEESIDAVTKGARA